MRLLDHTRHTRRFGNVPGLWYMFARFAFICLRTKVLLPNRERPRALLEIAHRTILARFGQRKSNAIFYICFRCCVLRAYLYSEIYMFMCVDILNS